MINKIICFTQCKKNANRIVTAVILFQIIVLGSFFIFSHGELYLQEDTSGYMIPAKLFLAQGKMLADEGNLMIFRTPGYPLFLAAIYGIGGNDSAVAVIQCVLVVLLSLLIYNGIAVLTGVRAFGVVGMMLYSLEFSHYIYAICILPDVLFGFLIGFSLWNIIRGTLKGGNLWYCIGAVSINLALLVKPTLMYMNLLLCLVIIFAMLKKRVNRTVGYCYLLVFLCLFGGWSFRNYKKTGYFMFSNIRYVQFFRWDGPDLMSRIDGIDKENAVLLFHEKLEEKYGISFSDEDLSNMQIAEREKEIGNEYVFSHMKEYILMNIEGLCHLLFRVDGKYFDKVFLSALIRKFLSAITVIVLVFIYVFYAIGFLGHIRKQKMIDWVILLVSMYLMAGTASLGTSRYRFAFLSLVISGMLASWRHHEFGRVKTEVL